jgi:hypothetical protein
VSRQDEIKELISAHRRRLHQLEIQRAEYGISVDPRIPNEIDNIKQEIKDLQAELEKIQGFDFLPSPSNEWPLSVGKPRSFAARGSIHQKLILEFPFIFINNGQTPIIVQNLRLLFPDEEIQTPLKFVATVEKLGTDKGRAFATQFPLAPGEAKLLICEFQRQPGEMIFKAGCYLLNLQAKLGDSKKWDTICNYSINVSQKNENTINDRFLVYDNDESWPKK